MTNGVAALEDFTFFAAEWGHASCAAPDFDQSGSVNLTEFSRNHCSMVRVISGL